MIELRGLGKSYGVIEALSEVSLTIGEGEFFSLLGPSGCGKTTLLRLLAGFEVPDRGGIWLDGSRVDRVPANKRNFNLVFQRYALFPHLDVFENIAFGLRMKRVAPTEIRSRVHEMMSLVRLDGFEKRKIATLSGGQQQRVALARALVNRPKVLLLDEPLSALDLKLRQQMQVELRAIQKRLGLTFVFVTHDQEEALTLSTRVAVMNAGRIEQIGSPREIYEKPATEFVARFIGSINRIDGRVDDWKPDSVRVVRGQANLEALPGANNGGLNVTAPVSILIRPEKVRLVTSAVAVRGNRIEGTVHEILYQGATVSYLVQPRDGGIGLLTALQAEASRSEPRFIPGDRVFLEWEPADAHLLDPKAGVILG